MKTDASAEVRVLFDLLLAEDWLAKSVIIGRERALLPAVRAILQEETRIALERGDADDASIFAAHVSLLEDIERRGLALVQADIICAQAYAS